MATKADVEQRKRIENELKEHLGEGFHTAFRKATSAPESTQIWKLINDMDDREWEKVIAFVAWGVAESVDLNKFKSPTKARKRAVNERKR